MEGGKTIMMVVLLLAVAAEAAGKGSSSSYYSKTKRAKPRREKETRVRFYLHDILSGDNPGAVRIGRANQTDDNPVAFGSLFATDDPMTVGPERDSEVVGNARGMYVSSSKNMSSFTIVLYMDFAFTTGKFNGSSFSVFSRNPVAEGGSREVSIVGGRGRFRMARGFAKVKTHTIDMKTGDAVLRYDATLIHH